MSLRVAIFLAISATLAAGCSRASVKADGSSTVYPITEAVAEEFSNENSGVRVIVGRAGTTGGFEKFIACEIDICNASRRIADSEKQACENKKIDYLELQVAFDGLSVIVNPENKWCDCLDREQLKTVWQPESAVKAWSDLNPEWPNEAIRLYGPGTDSGTFDYFTEVIVGKTGSSRSDYMQSEDDNVIVTGVAGDTYALGYVGLAYYEENKDKLKVLGIDGGDGKCVKPTPETVRENTYQPLSRPLFIYVRNASLARPEVRTFVKFYLDRVSDLVPVVGYVPVPDEVREEDRRLLEEALSAVAPAS